MNKEPDFARLQKLQIAKWAYADIKAAIDKWEGSVALQIIAHWDECITVEDELFHGHELREEK